MPFAGLPSGLEYGMPPPGAFTGDMSWANLAGQVSCQSAIQHPAMPVHLSAPRTIAFKNIEP
jgi:hypothetical protein